MPIPNIDHCQVCSGELCGEQGGASRDDGRRFSNLKVREQGFPKLGIDGRGREGFDFIIQLLAEALGGERIKGKSDDGEAGPQRSLPRDCKWLGSAYAG